MENTIGSRIREERLKRGWDQADLVRHLEGAVGQQTVSRWENGGSRPKRAVVAQLATVFEIDLGGLLEAAGHSDAGDTQATPDRPVRPRMTLLPVAALSPDKFEELVTEVARFQYPQASVTRFGGQGHKQFGVDIVAQAGTSYVATYQCKRHQNFGPAMVDNAVKEVAAEVAAAEHFLVLSRPQASPQARLEMKKHPKWQLWDAEEISRRVRDLPLDAAVKIVDTFFPGWRRDFLGVEEPGPWISAVDYFDSLTTGAIYTHDWHLVGRSDELTGILGFLGDPDQRVGIISGRGGIGKSRLLREVAVTAAHSSLAFLKIGAEVRPQHFDLLPAGDAIVVVIDDAHERDDLASVLGELLRRVPKVKVLLALRPYGGDVLAAELSRLGIRAAELPAWPLSDLALLDAEALAREALGKDAPDHLAQRLGRLTADCPFITVIAGVLIRRGDLDPSCMDHEDTVRAEVLRKFRDVVVADPVGGDTGLRRTVLDAIAVLQPFHADDPSFQDSLSDIVGQPYDRAIGQIRSLENAGVLLRRSNSIRIVPDLLGDVILTEAAFDEAARASTGFIERVWRSTKGTGVQHVFVNASRVDWQIRHDGHGTNGLTDPLWKAVDSTLQGADIVGRIGLLKLLKKVSYFEPGRSVSLVHWAIENPTDVVEDTGQPLLKAFPPNYDDVLHEVPEVLRAIAHNYAHFQEAVDLLWALAQDDRRETNPFPEHPLRVLHGLAEIGVGKPLGYNHAMIDAVERWLKSVKPIGRLSPLDVLTPMLATEGTDDTADGMSIRFQPFTVNPVAVSDLRQRVINVALGELDQDDVARQVHAIELIGSSLRYPAGLFGRQVLDTEREAWTPVFVATLDALAAKLAEGHGDPLLAGVVRRTLKWHLEYAKGPTNDAAHRVLANLPTDLSARVSTALFDGTGGLLRPKGVSYQDHETDSMAYMDTLAQELVNAETCSSIIELIETRLGIQKTALSSPAGNPGVFVWRLANSHPEVARAICARVVLDPTSVLGSVLPVTLSALADTDPDEAVDLARELMTTAAPTIRRDVAQAFGWNRGMRITLTPNEINLLGEFVADPDPVICQSLLFAVRRLMGHHRAEALDLLLRVRFENSAEVADDVFQLFEGPEAFSWDELTQDSVEDMLLQLVDCPSIERFWIDRFLTDLSATQPGEVVKLLNARIERWEQTAEVLPYGAYDPLPHQWTHPLKVRANPAFSTILKGILEWIGRDSESWKRRDAGGRLFASIAQVFDAPVLSLLEESIVAAGSSEMATLGAILRHAPRSLVYEQVEFVTRILRAAVKVGANAHDDLAGALYGAAISGMRQGTPGQPFSEDIEQRDKGLSIAQSLPSGSAEEQFYRSLSSSAAEAIRWHVDRDEKLLDGREW